jgi:hypothetical protein
MKKRYYIVIAIMVIWIIALCNTPMADMEVVLGQVIGFSIAGYLIYAWNKVKEKHGVK